MKMINTKIINQYLDGELDYEEEESVEKLLKTSSTDKREYLRLQRLDKNLKKMKSNKLSQNFTLELMNIISVKTVAQRKQTNFVLSMITLLVLPLLLITGVVIYNLLSNSSTIESSIIYTINNKISIWLGNVTSYSLINPMTLLWLCISSTLSITIYLLFEEIRRSKQYLGNIR